MSPTLLNFTLYDVLKVYILAQKILPRYDFIADISHPQFRTFKRDSHEGVLLI